MIDIRIAYDSAITARRPDSSRSHVFVVLV